jgi:predicted RNA-binding protein with PUA-like domain
VVTLAELKGNRKLAGMPLLQRGQRLSVQPVEKQQFDEVCRMAEKK